MNLSLIAIETLDSAEASDQESLIAMQKSWLNLGHFLVAAEHNYEFVNQVQDALLNIFGDSEKCVGASWLIACMPSAVYYIFAMGSLVIKALAYAFLLAATIAYQVVDHDYDNKSLGEYLCSLMSHISITNQTSCQFKCFFVSYVRCKQGHLRPIL